MPCVCVLTGDLGLPGPSRAAPLPRFTLMTHRAAIPPDTPRLKQPRVFLAANSDTIAQRA